jgi:hypothetical protein
MPSPSTTQASEPTWKIDLIGQLECDGPPASIGGEVGERFDPDVTLPKAARLTGYPEGGRSIWGDGDPDAIYVVMADRVERWPRALDPFMGCA